MSEEDTYKIFRQLEERQKRRNPYTFYDRDELVDEILKYEDEKEELQQRIDKAIEYIDMIQERRKDLSVEEYHNKWCKLFDYYESQCIMLDLLDILKGSDTNE